MATVGFKGLSPCST